MKKKGQLVFDLPKSNDELKLYVALEQRETAEDSEIKEDVLELEKPFQLEIKKKQQVKTKESSAKKKSASPASFEAKEKADFIGPRFSTQTAPRGLVNRAYQNQYENKQPVYTESVQKGKYPTNSWSPGGQSETIRNHQGGNSTDPTISWDGLTSWDISQDDRSKSYINYGDDSTDPNLAIRKFAYATDKEDEFNIRLNVRGNTTYKPGVDIVFLIDHTGTMSQGSINGKNRRDRANAVLKKMVEELIKSKVDENIRVEAISLVMVNLKKALVGNTALN